MSTKRQVKRRPKAGVLVRGEPVVRGVLEAALEELARVGYSALRIEDVAARASVNKTTIYRRWPTKEELVRAALLSISGDTLVAPNTGSLRGDLVTLARNILARATSLEGQGIIRMILAEGPGSELATIAKSLRKAYEAVPRSVLEAAAARGELAQSVDPMLLFQVLAAAVHHRVFMVRERADDGFIENVVDLLLLGALAPDKRKQPRARAAVRAAD